MSIEIPDRGTIKAARIEAGLTHQEAADLVHLGAFTRWYEYENGSRNIDLARWELFLIKARLHPDFRPVKAAKRARTGRTPRLAP